MTSLIEFGGEMFEAHPCGALYWRAQGLLIVADLHLEKSSFFAANKSFLPPYDTAETLQKLTAIVTKINPSAICFLGDSFHDSAGYARMDVQNRGILLSLLQNRDAIWIAGNHDPGAVTEMVIDRIVLRHEANAGDERAEISGHFHPCAKLAHKGQKLRKSCFAVTDRKMVLPAYGAFTGGLDVRDPTISALLSSPDVYVLGAKKVYKI